MLPDSSIFQAELRAVSVNLYMRVVAPLGCAFDRFYSHPLYLHLASSAAGGFQFPSSISQPGR